MKNMIKLSRCARKAAALIAALGLSLAWPATSQAVNYLLDSHMRAGDGGFAATTEEDAAPKAFGDDSSVNNDFISNKISTDAIAPTYPGSSSSSAFTGSDTVGTLNGTIDGRVTLNSGQASASGGQGGRVIINFADGAVVGNASARLNPGVTPANYGYARRYFFTAGNGNSTGAGGDVEMLGSTLTIGDYSAFFLKSGAGGGGNKGGTVSFDVDTLKLGTFYGGSIFFEQTDPNHGGQVQSSINTLEILRKSTVSYSGTSARYNTINHIILRTQAELTLLGRGGSRYNPDMPQEFDQSANYTAEGSTLTLIGSTSTGVTHRLNIQNGDLYASSLDFQTIHNNHSDLGTRRYFLEINSSGSANLSRPDAIGGEPLGALNILDLDKNDITFSFSTTGSSGVKLDGIQKTFYLIKGNDSDGNCYLVSKDYGTFAKNFGASMYLFRLDGSSGDLLLTYLGPDGGFTHYIKSYFEGRAAEATTVIAGGQFVADSVIANARLKARLNETTSSLTVGTSKIKTKTGSYVENDNYNAALSGAYLFELGPGRMLFGGFAEAGRGQYDYFHNYNPAAPQKNDGKSDYFGGGAFARYEFPFRQWDGFYAEASIRAGKIDNQFNGIFNKEAVTYNNHSSYYGGHIGLGKVFSLSERTGLDLYVKGFYNAVESGGVDTSAKENLEFDRIESITTRVGGRLAHSFTEQFVAYVGGSWEREHNGRVDGAYLGKDFKFGTSLKGDSALGEIGFNMQPSYLPLEVELAAFGKGGQQEGFGGSLSLKYSY